MPFTTLEVDTIVWQTLKGDEDVIKPRPPTVHFYVSVHYGKIYMKFVINPKLFQGDHTWRRENYALYSHLFFFLKSVLVHKASSLINLY